MKRILLIAAGICGFLHLALADTTWVSGSAGGNWNTDRSPFVIVGTVFVDEEAGLTVRSGVEILFPDDTSALVLQGDCAFLGAAGDSVKIMLSQPETSLRGHNALSRNVRFSYVAVAGLGRVRLNADSVWVQHSSFRNGRADGWGTLSTNADRTELYDSFMYSCSVSEGRQLASKVDYAYSMEFIQGRAVYIDSVNWIQPEDGDDGGSGSLCLWPTSTSGVQDSLIIKDSFIGRASLEILGVETPLRVSSTAVAQYILVWASDNFVIDNSSLQELRLRNASGFIRNNTIRGMTISGSGESLHVYNNNFINVDGCCLGEPNNFIAIEDAPDLVLEIVNNIFYSCDRADRALASSVNAASFLIAYNIVWRLDSPWTSTAQPIQTIELDPKFDPNSPIHELTYESPAIDAGYQWTFDPDGSRPDIGAHWWDHRFDHPPIITTPARIETRWGAQFQFTLNAVDEGAVCFPDRPAYPPWMSHQSNLDETSLTLFSGIVPFGVNSFAVTLTVRDEHGGQDRERIEVDIMPCSELAGISRGRLTTDYSPYHADRLITIPAGDTLLIDPGVHVQFDSASCGPALIVEGVLIAAGTEADSIYFEAVDDNPWQGIILQRDEAALFLDYCRVSGAVKPVLAEYARALDVRHSKFAGTDSGAYSIEANAVQDTVRIENCQFGPGELFFDSCNFAIRNCRFSGGQSGCGVLSYAGWGGIVVNSDFVDGGFTAIYSLGNLLVERCLMAGLTNATPCVRTGVSSADCDIDIRHNTMVDCEGGFISAFASTSHPSELSIYNNIFMGTNVEIFDFLYTTDSTGYNIHHNCFWDYDTLFSSQYDLSWNTLAVNAIVNSNGDSTDIYGNLIDNPEFADSLFTLPSISPCVNAGYYYGQDYWGAAPDIGFREFVPGASKRQVEAGAAENESLRLSIFPNPANASITLNVYVLDPGVLDLKLINILGQIADARQVVIDAKQSSLHWNLSALGSGRYFVVGQIGDKRIQAPLLILK